MQVDIKAIEAKNQIKMQLPSNVITNWLSVTGIHFQNINMRESISDLFGVASNWISILCFSFFM